MWKISLTLPARINTLIFTHTLADEQEELERLLVADMSDDIELI